MANLKVGDTCTVDHPNARGVWKVVKVNQTTYGLEQEGGAQTRAAKTLCVPTNGKAPVAEAVPDMRVCGQFVRYTARTRGGGRTPQEGEIFVVITDKGDKVNCARPGGEGGTYWKLQARHLVLVPLAEAVKELYHR